MNPEQKSEPAAERSGPIEALKVEIGFNEVDSTKADSTVNYNSVTGSSKHSSGVIIKEIIKRDGRVVPFDVNKIAEAIFRAAQSVGGKDQNLSLSLAQVVLQKLELEKKDGHLKQDLPTVEEVQDLVEKVLIDNGHAKTAKAYILYRHKRNEEREKRLLILGEDGSDDNLNFSNEALRILKRRYLMKDLNSNTIETPKQMLRRVAVSAAKADAGYGSTSEEVKRTEDNFYQIMANLTFLPNSPTLMNAGKKIQQLSSCFVLPIEDKMETIFGTLRDAALIHQRGGGTGFSFSNLRPKGDVVKMHTGVASGPVAFMNVYDQALDIIKQGGVRPGANMAVLRVDHPDIIRFIESKRDKKSMKNFNISVAVTDNFLRAVEADREYYVTNPRTEKYCGKLRARDVFAVITQNAWKTGDPGLIFIDEINRKHPAKHLGEIETTNQCGEAPLLAREGCALGAINVAKFVNKSETDLEWDQLKEVIGHSVHFLDNVIDVNTYLHPQIAEQTKKTRKFGLGIMGFADMLLMLGIKYDSEEGLDFAEKFISFFKQSAQEKSSELAEKRGVCPAWEGSELQKNGIKVRNMTMLALSPTGSRSILAGASAGCEPLFALSYQGTVLSSNQLIYVNKVFEDVAKKRGFYSPELIRKVAASGSIQHLKEIPKSVRDIFVTAQDISPEWHIKMQARLQKQVDNSISKTINFPRTAAIKDIEEAYLLAWKYKCKGITIYRDGSYEDQVINIGEGL